MQTEVLRLSISGYSEEEYFDEHNGGAQKDEPIPQARCEDGLPWANKENMALQMVEPSPS